MISVQMTAPPYAEELNVLTGCRQIHETNVKQLFGDCVILGRGEAIMIEIIENGGFEKQLSSWSQPTPNPNPWTIELSNPHTGSSSAFNPATDSALAATTLFQSFVAVPVEEIKSAGFWYFHHGGSGTVGLATLLTFSDGTAVQDTLFADDPSYKEDRWTFRNWMPTLMANPGKKLISVGFFPALQKSQYIDDVSITKRSFVDRFYRELAWAWLIIIGGLMITPGGIECIACGFVLTKILGVISVVIGITGFVRDRIQTVVGR
jgi:hypothetical protein